MAQSHLSGNLRRSLFADNDPHSRDKPNKSQWLECAPDLAIEQDKRVTQISSRIGKRPLNLKAGPKEQVNWLLETIETSVIPRLLVAHPNSEPSKRAITNKEINHITRVELEKGVEQLTRLVLHDDAIQAKQFVQCLCEKGMPLDQIYLEVLAPAARELGAIWDRDQIHFSQVTTAMWRIKQLIYDFSPLFQEFARVDTKAPHAMLVPLPGSQHTLGLFMVSEFFRRGGWKVWGELAASEQEIVSTINAQHFDLVGLSISTENQLPLLERFIQTLKEHSHNREIGVMVGGPIFFIKPELKDRVSADIVGLDAEESLIQAQYWIDQANPVN